MYSIHELNSNVMMKDRNTNDRQYLNYLDGLRCVAVICILFFHSGITAFSGGFIGVDVFFVISGFLMTRILAAAEPDFVNLTAFFTARLRRIFPAYVFMLVIVAGLSCAVLFPDDLLRLAPGLISAPFFLSNFVFTNQANYFDPDQEWSPILHTWSLGVEWQFYLLFPLLFILARRIAISPWIICSVVAAVSFCWSVLGAYGWNVSPTPTFYLLPARVWEFMVGALVAVAPLAARRAPPDGRRAVVSRARTHIFMRCPLR
jgi:peptidoglycan/LPS O-acetylase OafA/YrhL